MTTTTNNQVFFPAGGKSLAQVHAQIKSSILLVPAVSVANVPQLAVDLLIHSLGLQLVGRLCDEFVYPFAGPRDVPSIPLSTNNSPESTGISTAIEVYNSPELNLTVIQLRSPTLPNCRRIFTQKTLAPFIDQFQFSETVVAGSSNAALSEVVPAPRFKLFHQTSGDAPALVDSLSERLSSLSIDNELGNSIVSDVPKSVSELPESGFTLEALAEISSLSIIPKDKSATTGSNSELLAKVCAAVLFVYEGDNFFDAHEFADRLGSILGLNVAQIKAQLPHPKDKKRVAAEPKWIEPLSWQGVYGKEIPIGLEEGLYS